MPIVSLGVRMRFSHLGVGVVCNRTNIAKTKIEVPFLNNAAAILTGKKTHFNIRSITASATDLSVCSLNHVLRLSQTILLSLYGSDHVPMLITT